MAERKTIVINQQMGDELIEREYIECLHPVDMETWLAMDEEGRASHRPYPPLEPCTYLFDEEIECMQDVAVKMRDGVTIYLDIFLPVHRQGRVPAIISWSPYGKRPNVYKFDKFRNMQLPPDTNSEAAKFESPDPGYWCRIGYAVVNVDPRGVGNSEGNIEQFNTSEGRDGYDTIEWLAQQDWCSGRIGMGGTSAVAMSQWRVAAECPPHLACIAPWEGITDHYRESLREGGIPGISFSNYAVGTLVGPNYCDNVAKMAIKYPFFNAYWEDKRAHYENITCPVYATACWNHFHLRGSVQAWRNCGSAKKWIRFHQEFEWPDAFCYEGVEELRRFYDRYLKNMNNGWELTPPVRIEVMDALDCPYQTNRAEKEFPLERTEYEKLYIGAGNGSMSRNAYPCESEVSYDANTGEANFEYTFTEETELTGYMKLRLWVEARGNDDMDIFVNIKKTSTDGRELPVYIMGKNAHPGSWGKMRASMRKQSPAATHFQPDQIFDEEQKLSPGEIVPVDIEIWPTSRIWHKGQKIRVQVAGRYIREKWFEPLKWDTENKGLHVIHSGGKYDSYLQIPVIPPKYKDGDYIYR